MRLFARKQQPLSGLTPAANARAGAFCTGLTTIALAALLAACDQGQEPAVNMIRRADLTPVQTHPGGTAPGVPKFSPDGRWLVYIARFGAEGQIGIGKTNLSSGESIQLGDTSHWHSVRPAWSPDGRHIVYNATSGPNIQNNTWNIWIAPADGGAPRQLTATQDSLPGWGGPDWSPDGRHIVFASRRGGQAQRHDRRLWRAVADGTSPPQLLPGQSGDAFRPRFSPDGKQIAFVSWRNENPDLWIMPSAGGPSRQLTSDPASDHNPRWTPDGEHILFASRRSGRQELWFVAADGGQPHQLTDLPNYQARMGDFSPDGTRIALHLAPTQGELWTIPAGGGEPSRLTDGVNISGGWVGPASWSPDGKRVAYVAASAAGKDIWIVDVASGAKEQLTRGGQVFYNATTLSWSPDGKHVAFSSGQRDNAEIWTVPLDGGQPHQVTANTFHDADVCWSPDGQYILTASLTDHSWNIWRVPATGGRAEPLVQWPRGQYYPRLSADGRWLLLIGEGPDGEKYGVWKVELQSGAATWLATGDFADISPDGRRVVYATEANLWTIAANGGEPVPLLVGNTTDVAPQFSPDGRRILFYRRAQSALWLADAPELRR